MGLKQRLAAAAAVLLALGSLGGLAIGCHRHLRLTRDAARMEPLAQELLFECRGERAVIGGPPRDCDARAELHAAVEALFAGSGPAPARGTELAQLLAADGPPPLAVSDYLEAHAAGLNAVRESARCARACQSEPGAENFRRGTSRDAVGLLLLAAREASPEACLAMGLDAASIVSDSLRGLGSMGLTASVFSRQLEQVQRTVLTCARKARGAPLARAARDAASLVEAQPAVGDALAVAMLIDTTELLATVNNPGRMASQNVHWLQHGLLLDEAEGLLDRVARVRSYRQADFPALFDRLERELPRPRWAPFGSRASVSSAPTVSDLLDMPAERARLTLAGGARLSRRLRFLAVALAALRDHAITGALLPGGPAERAQPGLFDPLTARPFDWTGEETHGSLASPAARDAPAEAVSVP